MRRTNPTPSAPCAFLALVLAGAMPSGAQAPACDEAKPFRVIPLADPSLHYMDEPVKMDFDMDAAGNVDIWFVERAGKLRHWDAKAGKIVNHGFLPVVTKGYNGLTGLALDPAFKQNRHVFLAYSAAWPSETDIEYRVARFTLDEDGYLDPFAGRILLRAPGNLYNTVSALKFDGEGNLFISMGESFGGEKAASNTNDLRGKILRIHPEADGSFTIPDGNLFPKDQTGTRPEIYVMGVRTPYALAYDPVSKRLGWGEFGPDQNQVTEEYNATARPGNFGWPYFAGFQGLLDPAKPQDPAAPINRDGNITGLRNLPPALPPIHSYRQSGSLTGPFYRHQAGEDPHRLPPAYEGVWFVTDYNTGKVDTLRLDAAGTGKAAMGAIPGLHLQTPLDFRQGPDGALYALQWNRGLTTVAVPPMVRLAYQGCAPVAVRSGRDYESSQAFSVGSARAELRGRLLRVSGEYVLRLRDVHGRLIRTALGRGEAGHDLGLLSGKTSGILLAEVESGSARRTVRVALAGP